ncbi:MAG: hypothetical protein V7K77_28725 [Nostoc sp.]
MSGQSWAGDIRRWQTNALPEFIERLCFGLEEQQSGEAALPLS